MPGRRRSKPRPQRTPQQPRLAAFPRPAARAAGQPAQSARPYVTSRMSFIAAPVFAPESARPPVPTGSPGRYELTFVLTVPGRAVVQDEIDFTKLVHGGDSLLDASTRASARSCGARWHAGASPARGTTPRRPYAAAATAPNVYARSPWDCRSSYVTFLAVTDLLLTVGSEILRTLQPGRRTAPPGGRGAGCGPSRCPARW